MNMIGYALSMAKRFYDKDTYDHALRVATYVAENPMIDEENMEDCIALGIMHELWKDTDYPVIPATNHIHFFQCMDLLTKPKDMEYENYIKTIKDNANTNPEAYWVKMADLKDHLSETGALTDQVKEKYWKALPCLL